MLNHGRLALRWVARAAVSAAPSTGGRVSYASPASTLSRPSPLTGPRRAFSTATPGAVAELARWLDYVRDRGHRWAGLDPLGMTVPNAPGPMGSLHLFPELSGWMSAGGVLDAATAKAAGLPASAAGMSVADVCQAVADVHGAGGGPLGVEYSHCTGDAELVWWQRALEGSVLGQPAVTSPVSKADLRNGHTLVVMGETWEHFLAKKFETLKRYSGEGAEAMMPLLDAMFRACAGYGVEDVVIGMPHRGRLAMLVSLLQYEPRRLFHKLRGKPDIPHEVPGLDDVSSHVAVSTDMTAIPVAGSGAPLHVSLLHNPSHLEVIHPVACGKARAKRDAGRNACAVVIHGDAAVAGQGVVPEAQAGSGLPGYNIGGTLHVVVNNQVGFTATADRGRSTAYATDVAKAGGAPVLHVNAENMQAVIQAARLAVAYRNEFGKDVWIDLVGYRRHGHNELDEPAFTQPHMYAAIRARETYAQTLSRQLTAMGALKEGATDKLKQQLNGFLEAELQAAADFTPESGSMGDLAYPVPAGTALEQQKGEFSTLRGAWAGLRHPQEDEACPSGMVLDTKRKTSTLVDSSSPDTGVDIARLMQVGLQSTSVPEGFEMHSRLLRTWKGARDKKLQAGDSDPEQRNLDWATAEAMAFGTLLQDGHSVRMTGQDSQRGTFSHRHAVLHDQQHAGATCMPLAECGKESGAGLHIFSSYLSELAVLAYEYGYSLDHPRTLTLWEAQFGDFMNGAHIALDNLIAGSESKWLRQTGITLLLPHGFDGAGPEHSSCRMERFLQACNSQALGYGTPALGDEADADDKVLRETATWSVLVPTTPAQYFHALRRQQLREWRKPAVIVGPKTLLRHPAAVSSLADMGPGSAWKPVIGDDKVLPENLSQIVLCTGKVYYDLLAARDQAEGTEAPSTALVRVEELCPFPAKSVAEELAKLAGDRPAAPAAGHAGHGKARRRRVQSTAGSGPVPVFWAQEEPVNAGAWSWIRPHLAAPLAECGMANGAAGDVPVTFVGRPALASTAVGTSSHNSAQAKQIITSLWPAASA